MDHLSYTVNPNTTLPLKLTSPRHIQVKNPKLEPAPPAQKDLTTVPFSQLLGQALGKTSNIEKKAQAMQQQIVTDPNSLDPHDVTIAMAQADLSLSLTKSVVDRVVKAYQQITTLR